MAISRDKKQTLVAKMKSNLENAKMTVFAEYQGLSVADIQALRRLARESGVSISVIKNRLVRVALQDIASYKDLSTDALKGQLLYAISDSDEVAPAQILDKFAKDHDVLGIRGAFSADGNVLSESEVKALAKLPSKNQLIGEVIGQLLSPVNDSVNALSGNLHNLLDGLAEKAN
ncbi:MAG: 50S ribosomal protein L10 [Candidatus Nomurabacteria bacterium]|jgi:large subunit ribosomal protein L10|nr:50S ribosomal protein L10 [Candidatus Nomurabacteria bacterium]